MKNAIVLGAYGFIGASIVRALQNDGFNVRGVGRSRAAAEQTFPDLDWVIRDIPSISTAEWSELFRDVDLVVNATGALQDGVRDNLEAIHVSAVGKMLDALDPEKPKFVQISAANVSKDAPTAFFRTKADGDALIQASNADWVILRPVLVLGRDAYGGTALLRAAAAFPLRTRSGGCGAADTSSAP